MSNYDEMIPVDMNEIDLNEIAMIQGSDREKRMEKMLEKILEKLEQLDEIIQILRIQMQR